VVGVNTDHLAIRIECEHRLSDARGRCYRLSDTDAARAG
jgi:hypothetical protein